MRFFLFLIVTYKLKIILLIILILLFVWTVNICVLVRITFNLSIMTTNWISEVLFLIISSSSDIDSISAKLCKNSSCVRSSDSGGSSVGSRVWSCAIRNGGNGGVGGRGLWVVVVVGTDIPLWGKTFQVPVTYQLFRLWLFIREFNSIGKILWFWLVGLVSQTIHSHIRFKLMFFSTYQPPYQIWGSVSRLWSPSGWIWGPLNFLEPKFNCSWKFSLMIGWQRPSLQARSPKGLLSHYY